MELQQVGHLVRLRCDDSFFTHTHTKNLCCDTYIVRYTYVCVYMYTVYDIINVEKITS